MFTRAVRVTSLAVAMLLGITLQARAQQAPAQPQPSLTSAAPKWEVTGGYQLLHVPEQTFPFGLNLDGAWNLSPNFGLVAEGGWAMKSEDEDGVDADLHAWTIGVGPRWNMRNSPRLWPYGQVLVGALHARSSATVLGEEFDSSATRFMVQPGVGVNWVAGDGWGIVGAVDYRRVVLDEDEDGESGENQVRVFLGIRMILD